MTLIKRNLTTIKRKSLCYPNRIKNVIKNVIKNYIEKKDL